MSKQLVRAKCPGCGQTLTIPSTMLQAAVRCKHCGQVMRAKGERAPSTPPPAARETPPPAARSDPAKPAPAVAASQPVGNNPENAYVARLRERRRQRRKRNLIVAAGVLAVLGAVTLAYRAPMAARVEDFVARVRVARQPAPIVEAPVTTIKDAAVVRPVAKESPPEEKPGDGKTATDAPKRPRGLPPAKDPTPGRALLIGIRNYLYLNPLNPGYRPENSLTRDPLGLRHVAESLVAGLRFAENQVAELSDVAEKPTPPTRGTLKANVQQFLASCRPQDRAVLVYVGHAIEAGGKGFLVPLEGEPDKPETLLGTDWLYEQLEKCQAHRKLVIFDVARFDPEQGQTRGATSKLSEKLFDALATMPEGVEVWMSCSPGENSHEFNSSYVGSLFIHYLHAVTSELGETKKRKAIEARPGYKEESLPLVFLAPEVAKEVTAEAKRRAGGQQTPKLVGKPGMLPLGLEKEPPPPPVAIILPEGSEPLASAELVDGILRELNLNDMRSQSLPPFFAKSLADYQADKDVEFIRANPDQFKLRVATLEGANLLNELDQSFTMGYKHADNDAQFKKMLEKEQQKPAVLDEKIELLLEKMKKADAERDKEPSKRWRAHFDYVRSRLLARRIWVQEYNFVLGNKLKKDAPVLKNASVNNGWLIVPQEKLQQKDTRQWEKERQELIDKLIAEHPGTPWEILARRDKSTHLGLTLQEARVN